MLKRTTSYNDFEIHISILEELTWAKSLKDAWNF
jgi:hypothetical protein